MLDGQTRHRVEQLHQRLSKLSCPQTQLQNQTHLSAKLPALEALARHTLEAIQTNGRTLAQRGERLARQLEQAVVCKKEEAGQHGAHNQGLEEAVDSFLVGEKAAHLTFEKRMKQLIDSEVETMAAKIEAEEARAHEEEQQLLDQFQQWLHGVSARVQSLSEGQGSRAAELGLQVGLSFDQVEAEARRLVKRGLELQEEMLEQTQEDVRQGVVQLGRLARERKESAGSVMEQLQQLCDRLCESYSGPP